MTIREKAEKAELALEKVVELSSAAEIDVSDLDRELEKREVGKLNYAISVWNQECVEEESETVRFWSTNQTHIIGAEILGVEESVKLNRHVVEFDSKTDAELIGRIRKLKTTDIFEVFNKPFGEDSDEYIIFDQLLDEIMVTGHSGEQSRAGTVAVRALFSGNELMELGKHAFDSRRLKAKALRSKSVVRLINNGK